MRERDNRDEETTEDEAKTSKPQLSYIIAIVGGHGDNTEKIKDEIASGKYQVFYADYNYHDRQYRWRDGLHPSGYMSNFLYVPNPGFPQNTKRLKGLRGRDWFDMTRKGKNELALIYKAIEWCRKHKVAESRQNVGMIASQLSKNSNHYPVVRCEELFDYFLEKRFLRLKAKRDPND